jgi:hypothetical protein
LVQEHNSCKSKKAALVLEVYTFSFGYRFRAYPPINGYDIPSSGAELDSEIPVYFGSNCIQVTILTTTGVGVKPTHEVSTTPVDKWLTKKAMLNAWR